MSSITDYIKYVYSFIIAIGGVIAFGSLVAGGILYLTSAGEPERLKSARKQILASFLGIIILFSSYLILSTISPQLVIFSIPGLEEVTFPPLEAPPPEERVPKLLDKIKKIAVQAKLISERIRDLAQEIKTLTDECDCQNTQSLCMCTGGSVADICLPRRCYAGPTDPADPTGLSNTHPCPDFKKIKNAQQRIIAFRFEILYYMNRALAEIEDLKEEIEKVLKEKISYYEKNIEAETDEKVKDYFEEVKEKLEEEKQLKENLQTALEGLTDLIQKKDSPSLDSPSLELGALPDKCLYDNEKIYGLDIKCNAHCKGKCHDFLTGCEPDKCDGGNPCPTEEIQKQVNIIKKLRSEIDQKCKEILKIIKDIIELKTIYM